MEKKLDNLRWSPKWTTHLGCVKGCLDYLNKDVSDAWLFGATGHAFLLNIHEVVCPSGPTAWNTSRLCELGKNVGYEIGGVFGFKDQDDFAEKKAQAWEEAKNAINEGLPCYGWELDIPEYYVVFGYDDDGYYFSGPQCDEGKGAKPWSELGETEIGVLEMYHLKPVDKSDDATAIKEGLAYALEHSRNPDKWIFPKYKSGLAGYDLWMKALDAGEADGWGMAYNSAVWCECRAHAVAFLKEAKERVDPELGPLFDEAIEHYEVVAKNLEEVTKVFPFPPEGEEVKDVELCRTAIGYLEKAKEAEASGLKALENIASRL